jgi:hypothetical protein
LKILTDNDFEVTGLFYNPNIHPLGEYTNRKQAVAAFGKIAKLEVIFPEYNPTEFFQAVNLKEGSPGRCSICWSLRLKKTAQVAKERDFAYFSTTLLVSPYQDNNFIGRIGHDVAKQEGVNFYYDDFRPGFRKAHDEARAQGIYCQKYCGCIYSEIERCKQSAKH